MSGPPATQTHPIQMNNLLSPPRETVVPASDVTLDAVAQSGPEDDNNSSDSDEDFEDAVDYHNEHPAVISDPDEVKSTPSESRSWSIYRRLCHNVNSVLITVGMSIGLLFAYFQYQQQSWSNRMSALQTCLALEQSSQILANTSFCNETFQQEVRGMGARMMKRWYSVEAGKSQLNPSYDEKLMNGLLTMVVPIWLILLLIVLTFASIKLVQLYNVRYGQYRQGHATKAGPFVPPIHVSNLIPRTAPADMASSSGVETVRMGKVESRETHEHGDYHKAQSMLTKKMQTWNVDGSKRSYRRIEREQGFGLHYASSDNEELALALDSERADGDVMSSTTSTVESSFEAREGRGWLYGSDHLRVGPAFLSRQQGKDLLRLGKSAPQGINRLRNLIRTRNQLDHSIWTLRDARKADRHYVTEEMEESDAVLREILSIVDAWTEPEFTPEEWRLARRIKEQILMPGKRMWKDNPPWSEPMDVLVSKSETLEKDDISGA